MASRKKTPGPAADRLKLKGDWQDAMKRAVAVERPAEGFPKPESRYKARKKAAKAKKPKA